MEPDGFFTMESMLEVSLVEGGQQIVADDEIEVIIEDSVTSLGPVLAGESRTVTSSDIIIADNKVDTLQNTSASNVDGVNKETIKSPSVEGLNDEDKNKSHLSAGNLMATRTSSEEKAFYKEMFNNPLAIENVRLHCTACDRHLGLSAKTVVFSHRILRVLMCQRCYLFYDSGEFQQGEDGSDMFCRWCGQGGKLLCCSLCSNVFCEKCVSRNFGTAELRKIKKADDWFCFVCNLKSLWPARATCAELKNAVAKLKRKSALARAKEVKTPVGVDQSKCCSGENQNVKNDKPKGPVATEEQKKPLAMIIPLLKKKLLSPGVSSNDLVTNEQHPGYITIPSEQVLQESPSLLTRPPPLVPSVQVAPHLQNFRETSPATSKLMYAKTYKRVNKHPNPPHSRSMVPVRISRNVGAAQYCDAYSFAHGMPVSQTATETPKPNTCHQLMHVVSTNNSPRTYSSRPHYIHLQSRPGAPQQRNVGMLPAHNVVEPTLQLPNARLLAPNQVYTVPSSFISSVVKSGATLPQMQSHSFRAAMTPSCPPLMPFVQKMNGKDFVVSQRPGKSVDQNKVKCKWFVCGVEKFAGVSRVLWSHIHKLKQSFADMEAINDVRGMKATAGKLHRLLETAADSMKDIDKIFGKEFNDWCKSVESSPEQQSDALPEVIDITNDDVLMEDTPAEVIEVEISPDVVSLGQFSGSTDDVQCDVESSYISSSPAKTNRNSGTLLSASPNSEKISHKAVVANARSTVLDHAYSAAGPMKATVKTTEENDVTLDLDICCESDEDDHDGDESTADQSEVLKCDNKDVWGGVEYDSDNSLNDKLLEVMNCKQVPTVDMGDAMTLNEVSGEVEPNYECMLKSSRNDCKSFLKASLLKGKSTMTQTDSIVSSSMCKDTGIISVNSENSSVMDVPKKSSITVQTEISVGGTSLKKLMDTNCRCVAVQTELADQLESQKPIKPWSNEFDSFLKKLDRRSGSVSSSASENVTVPLSPDLKQSDMCLLQQLTVVKEDSDCSEDVQRLKEPADATLLPNCRIVLRKASSDWSVAPNILTGGRVRTKKEKLDYVDTNSAVSKVLRSERRVASIESKAPLAPEYVSRERRVRDFDSTDFEHVAKKIKCESNVTTKYPEIMKKMCIVKVERLKQE